MVNGAALAALNGDSTSSKPSTSTTSLTPPSMTDQPSELSASPPSRGLDSAADIDFEKETKVKYRRSSIVPDYRQSMFLGESQPAPAVQTNGALPVVAPTSNGNGVHNGNGHINGSTTTNGYTRTSRRTSLNGGTASPRVSDLSVRPGRRSISPESVRRQTIMGYPPRASTTNGAVGGAVSPLTIRSISPVGWRSGAVSPIVGPGYGGQRSHSPVGAPLAYRKSTLSGITNGHGNGTNGTTTPSLAAQTTLAQKKLLARHTMAGLTLDTSHLNGQQRPQTSTSDPEEDEEAMDEVISLSPAVRAPVLRFRRQSSGLSLNGTPGGGGFHPEASSMTLDTVLEGEGMDGKKYFGQDVNAEDLVAVNLENAFERL